MEHKGKWKKRWIALGLSLMMILAGLPVEGLGTVTVYAEGTEEGEADNSDGLETPAEEEVPTEPEEIPQFWGIHIDEAGNLNPWTDEEDNPGKDNNRYYKVTVSGNVVTSQDVTPEEAGTVPEEYSFYSNVKNHTLMDILTQIKVDYAM